MGKNVLAAIEAMLFASGEPLEASRIAQVLSIEPEELDRLTDHLAAQYEERGSGLSLIKLQDKYQICTRPEFQEEVRSALELRRNAPLSQAAFEVLAVVAYNQPVTRAFVEQVRGVDCSGPMTGLCQKGLIEEKGRLDLPGRPLVYGTTDQFLRCFSLSSLEELPKLPDQEEVEREEQVQGQTSFQEVLEQGQAPLQEGEE